MIETEQSEDWWNWIFFLFFFFFLFALCTPTYVYIRRSNQCGPALPAERYNYRPSRVAEVDEIEL